MRSCYHHRWHRHGHGRLMIRDDDDRDHNRLLGSEIRQYLDGRRNHRHRYDSDRREVWILASWCSSRLLLDVDFVYDSFKLYEVKNCAVYCMFT